jgi:hypothetical protein
MGRRAAISLVLLLPAYVYAQIEASVSGRIVDAASGDPVPFASVTASVRADGSVVTGVIADESGRFVIRGLPEGAFEISARATAHEDGA